MTWPVEYGGGGRSAARALRRVRAAHRRRARRSPPCGSPTARWARRCCSSAPPSSAGAWLPGILSGDVDVVHRHVRARQRLRRRRPPHPGRAATATTGSSTARRCGRRAPPSPTGSTCIARTDPDAKPHAGLSEFVVDMRSPGIEVRRIVDMTGNDHFCEVHLHDVRVPGANLVGELNGSFRQVMRQMEHERGGIDRLVSNRLLFEDLQAQRLGRHHRPARAPGAGRHRDRLPHRPPARAARDPRPGAAAVLGGDEDVLHRVRAAGGRLRAPASPVPRPRCCDPGGDLGSRIARAVCYAPAYTIMGGTAQILRNILGERTSGCRGRRSPERSPSVRGGGGRRGGGRGRRSTSAIDVGAPTPCRRSTITGLSTRRTTSGTSSARSDTRSRRSTTAADAGLVEQLAEPRSVDQVGGSDVGERQHRPRHRRQQVGMGAADTDADGGADDGRRPRGRRGRRCRATPSPARRRRSSRRPATLPSAARTRRRRRGPGGRGRRRTPRSWPLPDGRWP